ncbi:UbiH/UbiF/VisC/COQ6 family ubiquinone biosynthesis hydroxylase [Nitrospirillum sp. BR 11163]|uniref:UbiH/UbiF/VisC/COQ6 family ubiquinone biosynthesis hydroxylase n=1 Tax=Nitrospirillum sp. BR 11163 TaxID=3104323 RepID=UPI002AFFF6E3|nr:UbiH/UbiF/VisC/COQ6 family ubiquinone biosynthesis hydroxylase [Nitrospirillum sp. BR 11163]MEA1677544.1 UbiH/UbiF/VisC/COQ6 family ubiquinone biosynthesis hydroxylase [Nitrospirillum sp. BR 11163]
MSTPVPRTDTELIADVAIVGGGLAGLSLAAALGTAGVRTICIDRDSPAHQLGATFDGRTTAVSHGSMKILEGAGVWAHLNGDAGPILDIRVTDQNRPTFLHYDHREVGDRPFGYIVENIVLRRAQFARLAELPSVTHLAPVEVTTLDRGDAKGGAAMATITLADGRRVRARLVVGADGRGSLCRKDAGIALVGGSYDQTAIAVTVEHEFPHHGVAVEMFLPSGPFAMLPLTGNRTSIVWSDKSAAVPHYMGLDEAAFTAELQTRIGDWLGAVRPIGGRYSFPLSWQHAQRYIDRRLALISETIHAMHPIAGQGLNMGLRDLAALAEVIVDAWRLGLDVGGAATLERYQRWRRFDNVSLLGVTDGLTRLFSNDIGPLKVARGLGLAAVNSAPLMPLKKLFMRHAMGIVGELPRLVRGEPL